MNSPSGEANTEAAQCFEKGMSAMEQQDWDTAVLSLGAAVRHNPDELEYRKQKHRSCRRKFEKSGRVSRLNRVRLAAIRSRIRTARVLSRWAAIDQLAEDAVAIDPWNAQMFAYIADAAMQADHLEIAKYAWTCAVKIDNTNADYFRSFGALLQADGELEMAKSCFEKMRSIDPSSRIAEELIRAVDVSLHMDRKHFRTARKVSAGGQEQPGAETVDPKLAAFLTLAQDHAQRAEFAPSLEAYKRALEIAPDNRTIRRDMEDVEVASLQRRALDARNDTRQHPKCEQRRMTAAELVATLTSRETEILSQRVQENPGEMEHTYRLADCYRRASQPEKAIPLFQQLGADPQFQAEAGIGLGECLIRSGEAELGRQQLEAGLSQVDRTATPKAFKLAHYWLARHFESRREYATAVNHYAEITAVDIQFRDVAKRLQVLNTITWP